MAGTFTTASIFVGARLEDVQKSRDYDDHEQHDKNRVCVRFFSCLLLFMGQRTRSGELRPPVPVRPTDHAFLLERHEGFEPSLHGLEGRYATVTTVPQEGAARFAVEVPLLL